MSELTLAKANKIIEGALARARELKFAPLAVVVVDAHGDTVAVQREDGASMFRVDIATGKAWASVGMDLPSRTLATRAKEHLNFFVSLASTAHGKFLPQPGAALIRDAKGKIIGAAGASGGTGDEDEAACIAGIKGAQLVSDPAEPTLP